MDSRIVETQYRIAHDDLLAAHPDTKEVWVLPGLLMLTRHTVGKTITVDMLDAMIANKEVRKHG